MMARYSLLAGYRPGHEMLVLVALLSNEIEGPRETALMIILATVCATTFAA